MFTVCSMVGVLLIVTGGAVNAETEPVVTMETIVVTGTRTEERIEKVPANVTVIDQRDIENSNAKNVPDLLRSQEGIVVRDLLGNGKTAQVDLRGFGETGSFNTLVLVDGRRVNEIDLSGVDWTQVPLEQIERIEVVRGTGSVLYGDNATGGVINIITRTPTEELTASIGGIAGSYSRYKAAASFSGGADNVYVSLNVGRETTDGYRDNNDFETADLGGKAVFDATDFLSLELSGAYHSDENGLPGALTEAEYRDDRKQTRFPDDEAESDDGYLKFKMDADLGDFGSFIADVSYRDRSSDSLFVRDFGSFLLKLNNETWGMTPRYVYKGDIFNHANTLIAGVDVYLTDQDSDSFSGFAGTFIRSGVAEVERDTVGYYLNNDFSIFDNLVFSAGARRERVKYDLKQEDLLFGTPSLDDSVTEYENAFSAGLTFLYGIRSAVFARANRSFRFPLTDEVIGYDPDTFAPLVNEDLKPQTGKHYEIGVKHFFTEGIQGRLTLFRAEIEDEIFFDPTVLPFGQNTNHPETLHQGIEVGCRADVLNSLTVYGNYTYTEATFEKEPFEDNDIPGVPEHKGNVGFWIHDLTAVPGLGFSADYNYVGSSYAISDQENDFSKWEDYFTIDLKLSYRWKGVKAFLGANNITDEKYSQYAIIGGFPEGVNLYPAPERNYLAGLEFRF